MKKEYRLLKFDDFTRLMKSGHKIKSSSFVIYFLANTEKHARIGLRVTKKNGNAVVRNRIKRQIRAMLVDSWDFAKEFDLVIIAKTNYNLDDFHTNKNELEALLKEIGEKS